MLCLCCVIVQDGLWRLDASTTTSTPLFRHPSVVTERNLRKWYHRHVCRRCKREKDKQTRDIKRKQGKILQEWVEDWESTSIDAWCGKINHWTGTKSPRDVTSEIPRNVFCFLFFYKISSYPSNWIKFGASSLAAVELLLTACCLSPTLFRLLPWLLLLFGELLSVIKMLSSMSSGFGCIRMNGNSATRSLTIFKNGSGPTLAKNNRKFHYYATHPPKGVMHNLTFTLYCTMIPKFSRWDGSAILMRMEKDKISISDGFIRRQVQNVIEFLLSKPTNKGW